MKTKITTTLMAALLCVAFTATLFAQGTAFTYQGQLQNNGSPASGTYNLEFTLFGTNTTGIAIAGPVTNNAVAVTNGLFTTLVDFGNAFNGGSNWLEIAVSTNGANRFTTLAPRQHLTPAPYAITAENVIGIGNNNEGNGNFFIGSAGNATTTGSGNTANGAFALSANTTGSDNTANGDYALYANTTGVYNTANGADALFANTSGHENTANGVEALKNNTTGSYNTANGVAALNSNTTGYQNTANGDDALVANTSGYDNTANGVDALENNTTGSYNTANGVEALLINTTGNDNIALGYGAGSAITGYNNIDIGNEGVSGDNNIIRIGTPGTQTATYLAGNVAIGASSPVAQLDVEGSDDSGNFLQPIALVRNNDKGSAAAPSLTAAGLGNTGNGVLCVTTAGTGLLARFGNASAWVADIKTNGAIDALSFNTTSDRNMKENFAAVSAKAVLEKVVSLPISQWNFKQNLGINHIGPMAQDFYAAFNIGSDDKHIATVDEDGVALAAIQGLNQKLTGELQQKETEITGLKSRLEKLEQLMAAKNGGAQ